MPTPARRSRPSTFLRCIAALGACGGLGVAACGAERPQDLPPGSAFVEQRLTRGESGPADLLLVIDDSASMAERPWVAEAAAEMVRRVVAPPCVDDRGVEVDPPARAEPGGGCPAGSRAAWQAVDDLNIGVITTSIGAAGRAERCIGDGGAEVARGDAGARLMTRWAPDAIDDVATWQDRGFLAWDPMGRRRCGTEPDAYCTGIADLDTLVARIQTIVQGVGTGGCGDEAPLEAAWRFLGDPAPTLGVDEDGAPFGVDEDLLAQRAAFLRPWSYVMVALITDEDDCSFRRDAVGLYGTDPGSPMPRPRRECADDPASACCVSCIEPAPDGCPGDGGCELPGCQDPAACPGNFHAISSENDRQWRCRDPKRRFGLDLLYPTARYANGFGQRRIDPARLDLAAEEPDGGVENTLVTEHGVHVLVVGPVGWESIARRNADDAPDLLRGLDADGSPRGGYQTARELSATATWRALLADVPGNEAPIRLLSVVDGLSDETWRGDDASSVASIAPPRLDAEPPRALDVGFEAAAAMLIPSSPCGGSWRHGSSAGAPRFKCGGGCFPARLEPDDAGDVECHVIEAHDSDGDRDPTTTATCACDPGATRLDLDDGQGRYADWIRERLAEEEVHPGYDCFCAIPPVPGDARDEASPRHACLHDALPGVGVDGWCYLDAEAGLGNEDLLASCPPGEQRLIRLVGEGEVRAGARLHIGCLAR